MEEILNNLTTYGYIILFFYSLGGGFFALAAAGVLASMGKIDLATSIAVAFIGNFIGDQALLLFTRANRHQMLEYLKKHRRKLAYSHLLMKKYGTWVIFLQKYIYGVKTLVPIAIGLTRYDAVKFGILNFLAAAVWAVTIGSVSYLGGKTVLSMLDRAKENPWVLPLIGGAIIVSIAFLITRAVRK
ncbi:DedA family protein [Hydrogenimonas cancrithermarum]|uniref:Membrane protein n=1 Tax=Hydrogenimonas cancrithermarum TaxID=2993563 RepID=A0ABM8FM61_9BACT|nr:DedA family protein [Hydrogenimonas cancrithermarum]BDY12507.1 membrane protein [Hydrogenimonas cancrithermarum]